MVLDGLKQLRADAWHFTLTQTQASVRDKTLLESDSPRQFVKDCLIEGKDCLLTQEDCFGHYVQYCKTLDWIPFPRATPTHAVSHNPSDARTASFARRQASPLPAQKRGCHRGCFAAVELPLCPEKDGVMVCTSLTGTSNLLVAHSNQVLPSALALVAFHRLALARHHWLGAPAHPLSALAGISALALPGSPTCQEYSGADSQKQN
jgi:hypothetical protein